MTSKLYWFLLQEKDTAPSNIYPYPRMEKTTVPMCPQTVKLQNRTVYLDMAYNLDVISGEGNDYTFRSKEISEPNISKVNPVLHPMEHEGDNIVHIHCPYVFLSDNKDLEANMLAPDVTTKHALGSSKVIEGLLPVGRYGRSLDVAIRFGEMERLQLVKGDHIAKLVFNDDVELIHIDPTDKILDYIKSSFQVTLYTKGVRDIFKRAAAIYPYKELENCEKIIHNR